MRWNENEYSKSHHSAYLHVNEDSDISTKDPGPLPSPSDAQRTALVSISAGPPLITQWVPVIGSRGLGVGPAEGGWGLAWRESFSATTTTRDVPGI